MRSPIIFLTHSPSDHEPALWEIECSFQPESPKIIQKNHTFLSADCDDLWSSCNIKKKKPPFDLAIGFALSVPGPLQRALSHSPDLTQRA
jgi:hypothetical protein